jgi:hypothetical protein
MVRERDANERHDQQEHNAYEGHNHDWPEKIAHGMLLSRNRRPLRAISAHLQYIASASALLAQTSILRSPARVAEAPRLHAILTADQ